MFCHRAAWLGLLLLSSAAVAAATTVDPQPSRGELLAAACNACHGVDGTGSGTVPALRAATPCAPTHLESRLQAWRAQPEADDAAHLMVRVARGLDAEDITALVAWYRPEDETSCR